jgi:hypothetical protein
MVYVHDKDATDCNTMGSGDINYDSWVTFQMEIGLDANLESAFNQLKTAIQEEYKATVRPVKFGGDNNTTQERRDEAKALLKQLEEKKKPPTPLQQASITSLPPDTITIKRIRSGELTGSRNPNAHIKFYTNCNDITFGRNSQETFTLDYFIKMINNPTPQPIHIYVS